MFISSRPWLCEPKSSSRGQFGLELTMGSPCTEKPTDWKELSAAACLPSSAARNSSSITPTCAKTASGKERGLSLKAVDLQNGSALRLLI